jgi:hypothetical protein
MHILGDYIMTATENQSKLLNIWLLCNVPHNIDANQYKLTLTDKEAFEMGKEIRTGRGKLIGTLDERANVLTIRDGRKITRIKIPTTGLHLSHTFSDGVTEGVFIAYGGRPNAA